jgi:hypothetical protein
MLLLTLDVNLPRKMKTIIKSLLLSGLLIILSHKMLAQQSYLAYDASSKTELFSDGFDNNSNQWITDNQWLSGKISGGYYDITCKNYNLSTGLSYKVIFLEPGRDYEIETAIKVIRGTGALVFGMNNKYDHYRIEISDKNIVEFLKDTPSKRKKVEKLFSGSGNYSISKDTYNKLTVRSIGGMIYIFVNTILTGQFVDVKTEGDQIGFSVGTDSEISVDYLNVVYLKSQDVPLMAERSNVQQPPAVQAVKTETTVAVSASGPQITWISPSRQNTTLESFNANVRASVQSSSGLKSVLVYLNGVSKGEAEITPSPEVKSTFIIEKNITFGPGENNIYFVATNNEGATKSELRYFSNPSAIAPQVTWSTPGSANTVVNTENMNIGACIKSPTELKTLRLLVNGSIQYEDNVFQASTGGDCNYNWQGSVILKEGDNSVFIIATNIAGSTTSEKRVIKLEPALTEKRLALVFGNSDYRNGVTLKNPVNDANLMEGTLKELGFDVIKNLNATHDQMMNAIREFNEKLPDCDVALFYYAGHGNQVDGKNYLIPVDAKLEKPGDCKFEAVAVDFIVEEFEKYQDNTNIVILDACRNNPFTAWARGGEAGFRAMNFSSGTIIAFATSEGATAADGRGTNGLYTEELVKQMAVPQSILSVFMNTREKNE